MQLYAGTRWYRLYVITIQAFLLDNATHSINSLYTPVKKQAQQTLQKGNGKLNIN